MVVLDAVGPSLKQKGGIVHSNAVNRVLPALLKNNTMPIPSCQLMS